MTFDLGAYGFGFLAGILSVLSPCVLPLLPIVLGGAVTAHRYGAVALSAGLSISFVLVGLFVATIGFSIGLDGDLFRRIGAGFLLIFGVLMLFPSLQVRLTSALGAVTGRIGGDRLQQQAQAYQPVGLGGQLLLGLLLGFIWSPCVGPTLGAAATLAAQRQNLASVGLMMLIFGIGASLPLLVIGTALSRWQRQPAAAQGSAWRQTIAIAGKTGKAILGVLLILVSALILSGSDHAVEAKLIEWSPAWLTALTTRF